MFNSIRFIRSTQAYIFPIHLSEDIIPAAVFYATVTPIVAWIVLKKAIIEPMNAEERKRDKDKAKEVNRKRYVVAMQIYKENVIKQSFPRP